MNHSALSQMLDREDHLQRKYTSKFSLPSDLFIYQYVMYLYYNGQNQILHPLGDAMSLYRARIFLTLPT